MGSTGKTLFSWPLWLSAAAISGFVAMMVAVGLAAMVLWMQVPRSAIESGAAFLVISILLSLPALAQQFLLRRFGVAAPRFYLATVLGGWIMLVGAIEGARLVRKIGFVKVTLGMDARTDLLLGGLALGCIVTAALQSLMLPRGDRRFFFLLAVPGAIGGLAIALTLTFAALLLALDYPKHEYPVLEHLMAGFGFAIGWTLYSAATGWPIRRAIERVNQGAPSA